MGQMFLILLRILFPLDPVARAREVMRGLLRLVMSWVADPEDIESFAYWSEDRARLERCIAFLEYFMRVLVHARAREMLGLAYVHTPLQEKPHIRNPKDMGTLFKRLTQLARDFHHLDKLAARHAQRLQRDPSLCDSPLRLAATLQSTSPALRAVEDATTHTALEVLPRRRRGRWIGASSRRDGGGCASSRGWLRTRGPPLTSISELPTHASVATRPRTHPHALHAQSSSNAMAVAIQHKDDEPAIRQILDPVFNWIAAISDDFAQGQLGLASRSEALSPIVAAHSTNRFQSEIGRRQYFATQPINGSPPSRWKDPKPFVSRSRDHTSVPGTPDRRIAVAAHDYRAIVPRRDTARPTAVACANVRAGDMVGVAGKGIGRWRWLIAPFSPRGLSGFALLGFFLLSVLATGLGFADLRAANTDSGELSVLELGFTVATTLFVVTAMMVALHQLVAGQVWWIRLISFVFYLLFAVWTVGFGYGFFWKELAGQEFTERQFEATIIDLSSSITRTSAALETSEQATSDVASLATARAQTEASEGRTCANQPGSTPGEGPLMRSRFAFADRAQNLGSEVRSTWIAPVAAQRARLERQVSALTNRALPTQIPDGERATLEKLSRATQLPSLERRVLFTSVHEEARSFANAANNLRVLHANAFAARLNALAAEVGPDPARPGSADPLRAADPGYCWDVVLNEKLLAASSQLRAVAPVTPPEFEFLEGPKATRAAFFGLIQWIAQPLGLNLQGGHDFVFDDKAFLALFASIAVDLGIVFLTIIRDAPVRRRKEHAATGQGQPKPPRLTTILGRKR